MEGRKPLKGASTAEERQVLAIKLCAFIDASIQQQGTLPERWKRLEAMSRMQPTSGGIKTDDSAEPRTFPVMGPRVEQLVAQVCGPVLSRDPYFIARGFGSDSSRMHEVEQQVQFCNQLAQFDRKFRKATRIAAKSEPAIFRVHFEDGSYLTDTPDVDAKSMARRRFVGPSISVIHPRNFVCYPLYTGGVMDAKVVGHRFNRRAREIKEKQRSGEYFKGEIVAGDDPQEFEAGREREWSLTDEAGCISEQDDQNVECYELIFREDLDGDGFEESYLGHVAFRQKLLLRIERYGVEYEDGSFAPYSRPWYFEHILHEPDDEEFYRSNPFAQNLQGVQIAFDDLLTLLIDGSIHAAFPAGFTNNPMLTEKIVKYRPGSIYYVPGDGRIEWTAAQFNPGVMPQILELLERLADSASKLSQAGTGQQFNSGTTATEVQGILAGQQVGMDEYRANACQAPTLICDWMRELCYLHYAAMQEAYGAALPCQDWQSLKAPVIWEPNGKSSASTPEALVQKVQMVLQLAQVVPGLNVPELGRILIQALDLGVEVSKILPDSGGPHDSANAADPGLILQALQRMGLSSGSAGEQSPVAAGIAQQAGPTLGPGGDSAGAGPARAD